VDGPSPLLVVDLDAPSLCRSGEREPLRSAHPADSRTARRQTPGCVQSRRKREAR
jgi:hypothetical protein